jgi:hypothetical protein
MASTFFQDFNQNNPIVSSWLNDVNNAVYGAGGLPKASSQSAAAWVRFSITAGVVAIQQSANILSVVRSAVGVYVVTYVAPLTGATNCYNMSMNTAGFMNYSTETAASVTINTNTTGSLAFDPGSVSLTVFGAN